MKNFFLFLFCAILISFSAQSQNKLLRYTFSIVSPQDTIHDATKNGNYGTLVDGAFLACGACIIGRTDSDYLSVPASVINGLHDFTIEMKAVTLQRYHNSEPGDLNTIFSSSNTNCTYCFGIAYNTIDATFEVTMHGTMHAFPYPQFGRRDLTLLRENGLVRLRVNEDMIGEFYSYAQLNASTFIFGQHEQCPEDCFDKNQALYGGLTQLQIWDGYVDQKQMDDDAQEISSSIFPNPFSSSTTISFSLQQNSPTTIELLDVAGREIKTLLDENLEEGNHEMNLNRESLAAGIYFLQLETASSTVTKKIVVE